MRVRMTLLLAGLLALTGLTFFSAPAYAADPLPCTGAPDGKCIPANTSSDSSYPAGSGRVAAGAEKANPKADWTVLVPLTLPVPNGLPTCAMVGQSATNPPCFQNNVRTLVWNAQWGEWQDKQQYSDANAASYDKAVEKSDYKLILFVETLQIYRTDGPVVVQQYFGTYDRRGMAPPAAPDAKFTTAQLPDGSFRFTNTSTDFYERPMTYQWDFGDGSTSGAKDPEHAYVNTGRYVVTLTVSNGTGLTDEYQMYLSAQGNPLQVDALTLDPASPTRLGEPLVAHVKVKNHGTTAATGITPTATLTPSERVALGDGFVATPFNLAGGASKTFDVPIDTLASGEAQVKVKATGTVSGQSTTASASLAFDIAAEDYVVTWSTDPARPQPGQAFDLTAHVKNQHGSALHAIVPDLTVTPTAGTTVGDPAPATIASLASGGASDVTWRVTSTQASLKAALALTGQDAAGDEVTGTASKDLALHDIEVNETGDQPIDEDALADGRCDIDSDDAKDSCTLRAAIQLANSRGRASAISFKVPGSATPRISPASPLPALSGTVTIDGRTQASGRVELHGPGNGAGVDVGGAGSTIAGLVVNGFDIGVRLAGEGRHRLLGNRVGTNVAGTAVAANRLGILVVSPENTIGGTTGTSASACAGDCNLLAGNRYDQVTNHDNEVLGSAQLVVQGNWLGVDTAGRALAGGAGLSFTIERPDQLPDGARLTIGGSTARPGTAPGNLVGVTGGWGLGVGISPGAGDGTGTGRLAIAGNSVGLDPSGARSNGSSPSAVGIFLQNQRAFEPANLVVGGASAAEGNVVGGFQTGIDAWSSEVRHNRLGTDATGMHAIRNETGLSMKDATGWDNLVSGNQTGVSGNGVGLRQGNVIGLAADGVTPLPNGTGVRVLVTGIIGAENLFGPEPTCPGPCNVISGNRGAGVLVDRDDYATGIRVAGTYIGTDVTGTRAVPNAVGISVRSPSAESNIPMLRIGGASPAGDGTCSGACNVIAANTGGGIAFNSLSGGDPEDTTPNPVQGNFIGLDAQGDPMPNGGAQVRVSGTADGPLALGGDRQHANLIVSDGAAITQEGTAARVSVRSDQLVLRRKAEIIARTGSPGRPVLRQAVPDGTQVHVTGSTLATLDPFAPTDEVELYGGTGCDISTWKPVVVGTPARFGGDFTLDVPASALANFTHLRVVRTTAAGATSKFSACLPLGRHTSTAQTTPAGTTEMQVASNDGFAPGDYVTIDPGEAGEETAHVVALGSLILAAPLRHSHAADAVVEKVEPLAGDRTAPTVTVKKPAARASYEGGQTVTASVRCVDKGVGVALCGHPRLVDTKKVGKHTFVVTAVDRNGNTRTVRVAYSVRARKINLAARDTTPKSGHRARLAASVPAAVHGKYRIAIKDAGSGRVLKTCAKARSCAVWPARRSGNAKYVAELRSTARGHRLVGRSVTVLVRWS